MSAILVTIGKALATAAFIAVLSEVAKRSTWLAAVMVALPLATMLTVFFIATDPKAGPASANAFANTTFLLVWPGLVFFIGLWLLQRFGLSFWISFAIAVAATFLATWGATLLYKSLGVKL
jgi:Na+-translocating ferredoxin:NAD+ oxidoreductase RnfD subunit